MAFFDLFRPKWRHSDPDVRAEAVRGLDDDQQDLFGTIAGDDPDPRVRRVALKRVVDPAELLELAAGEEDPSLKSLAEERGLAAIFVSPRPRALAAVDKLRSARELVEVVRKAHAAVAQAAVNRLADEAALADAAVTAPDVEVRRAALAKIRDADHLREVCLRATDRDVALAALERVNGAADLQTIAGGAKNKAVRKAAADRLGPAAASSLASKKTRGVSTDEKRRRARLLALCVAAENFARSSDFVVSERRLDEVRAQWAEIPSGDDDDALTARFEAAFEVHRKVRAAAEEAKAEVAARKAEERRRIEAAVPAPPPVVVEATAPVVAAPVVAAPAAPVAPVEVPRSTRLEALCVRLEALTGATKAARTALEALDRAVALEGWQPAIDHPGDDLEDVLARRFATARARVREELDAEDARRALVRVARLQTLSTAVTGLERKLASGATKGLDVARREAAELLKGRAALNDPEEQELRGKLEAALNALAAHRAEKTEAENWRRWANVPKLDELVKEAEALAEVIPTVDDKARAPQLLKDLRARWKAVGAVPPERSKPLWDRFDAACNAVHDACKDFYAKVDGDRAESLKAKEELCVRAEALSDSTDWKATSDALKALQEEWKATGHVPRGPQGSGGDAVWTRFRTACDKFFLRLKAEGDADREGNYAKKVALAERAEALAGSTEWKATGEALKALQDEWKLVGHVPREKGDEVWERFRTACDRFFAARNATFAEQDEERGENLRRKEELCVRAEALAAETDRDAAQDVAKGLQTEWKHIGHVPREQSDAIWDRFRAACDLLFEDRGDDDAPPAPAADATGLSGFTNRLPLGTIKLPPG